MKKALITGITGQDGSYLAELLLSKGYEVHGLKRRASSFNTERVDHLYQDVHSSGPRFFLHYADLNDASSLTMALSRICPDEIYNLGAQSHVKVSFEIPGYTADVAGLGTLRLLEAIRELDCPAGSIRLHRARCSVVRPRRKAKAPRFTRAVPTPAPRYSPIRSPSITARATGVHASCGILFNHESPRRGETFVTRKITRAVARIKFGLEDKLYLGNLAARRDWGYAGDYVRAMWLIAQQDSPDDYVIGTGETHSVREFVEAAFACASLDWQQYVAVDPRYYRPAEVDALQADSSKARRVLGWEPAVTFKRLVRVMVDADTADLERALNGGREALRTVGAGVGD